MKNKFFSFFAAAAVCLILLLFTGCPDDREYLTEGTDVKPPVVSFVVNAAGDAFENVGTGTGYTAAHQRGAFETVNGLKVFNTGGTAAGTQSEIPWWEGNYWDNYKDIGYVNLGAASGDLIASLGAFSIELYFCLPENAQSDRPGQHFFGFTDKVSPDNTLWLNWGNPIRTLIRKDGTDVTDVGLTWDQSEANRGAKGQWHHLVFTADGTTVKVYLDGAEVMSGAAAWSANYFSAGTLSRNVLGGEVYANGVYDQQLFNTQFHSFSIYESALSPEDVAALKDAGTLNTLNGN
jgi:hypothetical protein